MLFSSFSFLFWFLPAVLTAYFLPPWLFRVLSKKRCQTGQLLWQNGVLLLFSLLFYAWGEPLYLFLMLTTITVNFLLGLWLSRARKKRAVLWLAVFFNIGLLFYFKYASFFLSLIGVYLAPPHLPLGISFYTFQVLSYVADVYFGTTRAEKSPLRFATYVTLFPQLVAGPIVRYDKVASELKSRTVPLPFVAAGARRFIAGLAKKVLVANVAGELFHTLLRGGAPAALGAWVALVAFSLQIYFDFSGYSDMAIGLGAIFGFRFPENFNYPYTATSIRDFWRRWHITLSSFFKTYVYIPLGGSRNGVFRTVMALFVVWSLTGLWHGATFNFLLWGIYYFVLLVIERFLLREKREKLPLPARHALTLLGILFGWLIFAFDGTAPYLTLGSLPRFLFSLFGASGAIAGNELYECLRHLPFLLIAALGATPLPRLAFEKLSARFPLLSLLLPPAALLLSLAALSGASFQPFLYFRF